MSVGSKNDMTMPATKVTVAKKNKNWWNMNVYRELNFGSSHKDQPQLKHAIFRKIAKTRYLKKIKNWFTN